MNEYGFIMALNADNNFFVGDDWQAIYKFKGGDVRIFLNIMEDLFQTNMETSQILSFVKEQINHPSNWSIDTYSLNGTGT